MSTRAQSFHARVFTVALFCIAASFSSAQSVQNHDGGCKHVALTTQLMASEDSVAIAADASVVRARHALVVTKTAVQRRRDEIYCCDALLDGIESLINGLNVARVAAPAVSKNNIGGISGAVATIHGKVTAVGETGVVAQWFQWGQVASELFDSLPVGSLSAPISAVASGLANGITFYVAACAQEDRARLRGTR